MLRGLQITVAAILFALVLPALAHAQNTVLQGGPWQPGHVGTYAISNSQPVLLDVQPRAAAQAPASANFPSPRAAPDRRLMSARAPAPTDRSSACMMARSRLPPAIISCAFRPMAPAMSG